MVGLKLVVRKELREVPTKTSKSAVRRPAQAKSQR